MRQLLLIINEDKYFLSHRREIAVKARSEGWQVTVVAKDTGHCREIEDLGVDFINLPIQPTGMSPWSELKTFLFLRRLLSRFPDAVVHFVGLKNMLWGGLASRIASPRATVFAVSGLGTLFGENRSAWLTRLLLRMLRIGINRKHTAVIFQNHDDEALFLAHRTVKKENIYFIKGSGVNLNEFKPVAKTDDTLRVIFTGRMIAEKGVIDLIDAAQMLKDEFEGKVEFLLCGGTSTNPSAIDPETISQRMIPPYLRWLGHRNDVATILSQCDIICFPSYYREGVPKSLLEASACGLPIITCDSVGCRDTVEEGVNGLLVPPHRPDLLADALRKLLQNSTLRLEMGRHSRQKAEEEYDIDMVTCAHLSIYESLFRDSEEL